MAAGWSFQVEPVAAAVLRGSAATTEVPIERLRTGFAEGAVQTVYLVLNDSEPVLADLVPWLSTAEQVRVQRASDQAIALRFALGRWFLRSVLGALLGLAPETVALGEGDHGKPILESEPGDAPAFNLAHSGVLAVLALARSAAVGVDLERFRPLTNEDRLARRILTAREAQWYRRLAKSERETALLSAWVRKEAVLKALGAGVSGSPAAIETELYLGAGPRALRLLAELGTVTDWWLSPLSLPEGYLGALAFEGRARPLLSWQARPFRS